MLGFSAATWMCDAAESLEMIGYSNAFGLYTATSVAAIGLILLARRRTRRVG
jgi:hypothetical protein